MNAAGVHRFRKWEANHKKPLAPLPDCVAGVFMDVNYFKGEMVDSALWRKLREIDPQFEVVYDRCTTNGPMMPGFHLYRRVEGLEETSGRRLKLEFSLQFDVDAPWPTGQPREPGLWLIEEIRKRDKARLSGDKERADALAVKQITDAETAADEAADKAEREKFIDFNKEIQAPLAGKVAVGMSTTNERHRNKRKNKIQVRQA